MRQNFRSLYSKAMCGLLLSSVLLGGCAAQLNATRLDSEVPGGVKVTMLIARDLGLSFHGRSAEFLFRVNNPASTPLTVQTSYIYLATRLGLRWCRAPAPSPHLPTPPAEHIVAPKSSDDVTVRCRIDGMQTHDEIKIGLGKALSYNNTIVPLPLLSLLVE